MKFNPPLFPVNGIDCKHNIESLYSGDSGFMEDGMTELEPIHISLYNTVPQEVVKGRLFCLKFPASYWLVKDDNLFPVIHATVTIL